ncbi:MAG: type III secretion system stator protein SctL [Bryobacteraceae bacterium]
MSHRILKQEQVEASGEAASVVEQARREAAAIVEAAKSEADRTAAAARERGYAEGLAQWNAAVQDVLAARERFVTSCEPEIAKIAVKVAGKILGEELRSDPLLINRIVGEALRGVRAERSITIAVHPAAVETVRGRTDALEAQAGGECHIRVVGRDSVGEGGCLIETELGTIDARLDVQLRCLEQVLLRELED